MRLLDIAENIRKKLVSFGMRLTIGRATGSKNTDIHSWVRRLKRANISRRANPVKRCIAG